MRARLRAREGIMIVAASVLLAASLLAEAPLADEAEFTRSDNRNVYAFLGNLHSHTSYSDGSGTPADAFQMAKDSGMDFLAVTEHNHALAEKGAKDRTDGILIATNHKLYNGTAPSSLISMARAATSNGSFVALYGQEFSSISQGNHVNVFDAPEVIDVKNGDFKALLAWLGTHRDGSGQRPVVQFNHPADFKDRKKEYGRDDFGSEAEWVREVDRDASLVEIANGPGLKDGTGLRPKVMQNDFYRLLDLGFHLSPVADQDNHYYTWGPLTDARTGLVTTSLTKRTLLTAMRRGRSFASEDRNLRVVCWVEKQLAGSTVNRPNNRDVRIALRVKDGDEPNAEYRADVYFDRPGGGPASHVGAWSFAGNTDSGQVRSLPGVRLGADGYLTIKLSQKSGGATDDCWLAPVWLE